jgi:hypothetical protein
MVENHALAVVHLYEALLDFYEVLSSGEQAADPKEIKQMMMRYNFLFVNDIDPQVPFTLSYYIKTVQSPYQFTAS